MARGAHGEVLRHVRMLFETGAVGGLTDRQLLERFRAHDGGGDGEAAERAFAALVERHGPMVLRVCRRSLRDEHDAQDAFQASFLVLVRKAGSLSLRNRDSIGPWLHGVACRVAACARSARLRRRTHEQRAAEAATAHARNGCGDGSWDDLGPVLHEEINRLPEAFRAAVVLCDLEGLTQEQAAQRLGWPSGTVRSRLARGRGRLQAQLTRRGLAPTGTLAAVLTAEAATAAVPAALANATVRAATLAAAGQIAAGTLAAVALTEGVLKTMFLTKLKLAAVAALAIGTGASGSAVLALHQSGGSSGGPAATVKAEGKPGGTASASLEAAGAGGVYDPVLSTLRQSGIGAQDFTEAIKGRIALTEWELKRAEDRLAWATRMSEKGYLSQSQVAAAEQEVLRFKYALELARTTEAGVALAERNLKRTEDRLAWSERMAEKGYVSQAQLASDRRAVEQARQALALVREDPIPLMQGVLATNGRPSGSLLVQALLESPHARTDTTVAKVASAEADLKRFEDRLAWATQMSQKGYVSQGQVAAAEQEVLRFKYALGLARTIETGVALAEADLKRAQDQLAWSERMMEKGYLSGAQLAAARGAVEPARRALELARKDPIQQIQGALAGNDRPSGPLLAQAVPEAPDARAETTEAGVALAEADLKRAQDRLEWANRMLEKGYLSKSEALDATQAVEQAKQELTQARKVPTTPMQGPPAEDAPTEEQKRHQIDLLAREVKKVQAELQSAWSRLDDARRSRENKARLRDKSPGPLSEAEWKLAEAKVAAASADRDLKLAELRLLELRLDQAEKADK